MSERVNEVNHFSIPDNINFDDPKEAVKGLWAYILAMQEQMEYFMRNIETENFNETSLDGLKSSITDPVTGQITELKADVNGIDARVESVEGAMSELSIDVDGVLIRITGAEGAVARLTMTLNGLTITTGQGTTYIDGSQIMTGSITADKIATGQLVADEVISDNGEMEVSIADGEMVVSVSGSHVNCGRIKYAAWPMNEFQILAMMPTIPMHISSNGELTIDTPGVSGALTIQSGGILEIGSDNNIQITSSGTLRLESDGNMAIESNGGTIYMGKSGQDLRLYGNVYVNGTLI